MSCNYADGLSPYENKGVLGLAEIFDSAATVKEKSLVLAEFLKEAKHVVIHTGAGISTSAGIPDFRGPKGVWTLEEKGLKPDINISFSEAKPTKTHMALKKLIDEGLIHYIISQNIDGLHLKSGIKREFLAELHGNMFIEQCNICKRQFVRSSPSPTVGKKTLGTQCRGGRTRGRPCRGKLQDIILDWEHSLPDDDLDLSEMHSSMADLSITLGTTLQIVPSGNIPLNTLKYGGKLVICNLQPTKHDNKADVIINTYVDDVMVELFKILELEIPEYLRENDPVVNSSAENVIDWTIPKKLVAQVKNQYKKKCDGVAKKRLLVKRKNDNRSNILTKPTKKVKTNNVSSKKYSFSDDDDDDDDDDVILVDNSSDENKAKVAKSIQSHFNGVKKLTKLDKSDIVVIEDDSEVETSNSENKEEDKEGLKKLCQNLTSQIEAKEESKNVKSSSMFVKKSENDVNIIEKNLNKDNCNLGQQEVFNDTKSSIKTQGEVHSGIKIEDNLESQGIKNESEQKDSQEIIEAKNKSCSSKVCSEVLTEDCLVEKINTDNNDLIELQPNDVEPQNKTETLLEKVQMENITEERTDDFVKNVTDDLLNHSQTSSGDSEKSNLEASVCQSTDGEATKGIENRESVNRDNVDEKLTCENFNNEKSKVDPLCESVSSKETKPDETCEGIDSEIVKKELTNHSIDSDKQKVHLTNPSNDR